MKKLLLSLMCGLILSTQTQAATFSFDSVLDLGDFEAVMKEFSTNFLNSSVTPPSTFGKKIIPMFSFQAGLSGGVTKSPEINRLISTEEVTLIPHAGVLFGITGPYGITLDGLFLPSIDIDDVDMNIYGFGAKWTVTNVFWEWLPITLATRAHYNSVKIKYSQTINNESSANIDVDASVAVGNTVWGINAYVGYPLLGFLEPYVGAGFADSEGDLTIEAAGGATFLGKDITISNTASVSNTSLHLFAGLGIHLFIMSLGLEYNQVFGNTRYSGKVALEF